MVTIVKNGSKFLMASSTVSRNQVAVMEKTKREDPPSPFEEILGAVLFLTLPVTWLFSYFFDLVRHRSFFSYLLKLDFVTLNQKNLIFLTKRNQILSSY